MSVDDRIKVLERRRIKLGVDNQLYLRQHLRVLHEQNLLQSPFLPQADEPRVPQQPCKHVETVIKDNKKISIHTVVGA